MRSYRLFWALNALATILLIGACSKPASEEAVSTVTEEVADVLESAAPARTPSAEGARVFIIIPADGDTVSSPVRVEFGVANMSVVKAGEKLPQSGHHHLLIDTGTPDLALPIPADENHRHFGDGSSATELTLESGEHTLRLLFADYLHIPHDPPLISDPITITVE